MNEYMRVIFQLFVGVYMCVEFYLWITSKPNLFLSDRQNFDNFLVRGVWIGLGFLGYYLLVLP